MPHRHNGQGCSCSFVRSAPAAQICDQAVLAPGAAGAPDTYAGHLGTIVSTCHDQRFGRAGEFFMRVSPFVPPTCLHKNRMLPMLRQEQNWRTGSWDTDCTFLRRTPRLRTGAEALLLRRIVDYLWNRNRGEKKRTRQHLCGRLGLHAFQALQASRAKYIPASVLCEEAIQLHVRGPCEELRRASCQIHEVLLRTGWLNEKIWEHKLHRH